MQGLPAKGIQRILSMCNTYMVVSGVGWFLEQALGIALGTASACHQPGNGLGKRELEFAGGLESSWQWIKSNRRWPAAPVFYAGSPEAGRLLMGQWPGSARAQDCHATAVSRICMPGFAL